MIFPRSPLTDCVLFCGVAEKGVCDEVEVLCHSGIGGGGKRAPVRGERVTGGGELGAGRGWASAGGVEPQPQLQGGCPGAALDSTHVAGDVIEAAIAVNPADRRNLVGTWQQDLGFNHGAQRSHRMVARRRQQWGRRQIPGLTVCTGGTADSASDPWISVGPDGTAYFLGIEVNLRGDLVNPPSAIVASRSHDGGRTWTRPVTVSGFEPVNDTDAITASPTRAGHAYAAWANWDHTFNFQFPSSVKFSRTTDGGATWSRPVAVDLPDPGFVDFAPRLVVLPDGTLMMAYTQADLAAGIGRLFATRSVNEGRTWLPTRCWPGRSRSRRSSILRQAM